jgi:hypothetical protein
MSNYILLPESDSGSPGNVDNLGQVGGNGPITVDASLVTYVSFSVGHGNDSVIGNNDNTVTLGSGQDTVTGGSNDTITLGGGLDTVTLSGTGNIVTAGGGSAAVTASSLGNTLVVNGTASLSISHGQWVVTEGHQSITLTGIGKVVIDGQTYDLVDRFGAGTGGFQSLQAAIDASSNGDKILVAPGTYTESADYNSSNNTDDPNAGDPIGLLINKSVTIEGVDSHGAPITSADDTQATIVSSIESDFGTNFIVTAPDVTVTGLDLQATDNAYGSGNQGVVNKAVEVTANGFTLENSQVTATSGVPLASSIYVDEPSVPQNLSGYVADISSFDIADNILTGDFGEANGVGYGDANTNLLLTDNKFSLNAGTTAGTYVQQIGVANVGLILDGQEAGIPWLNAPVALPNATGNTMDANYTKSPTGGRLYYFDENGNDAPTAAYIQNYVTANHFSSYAYALTSGGAPDTPYAFGGYSYQIYINVGDATNPKSDPDGASPGDTIVVQSAWDSSVQTVGTNDLTIEALQGSASLTLALGKGVTTLALADYAPGHGANVVVTGSAAGESIAGDDGNDSLTAGAKSTITAGNGKDVLSVGNGTSAHHSSITAGNGSDMVTAGAYTDVALGNGYDNISLTGNHDTISSLGTGHDTISASGSGDQIALAGEVETITLVNTATDATLNDGSTRYYDTVVGFSESAGDTIRLTGSDTESYALAHAKLVNGNQDTQITLNDGSTILLKNVTHIDAGTFGV